MLGLMKNQSYKTLVHPDSHNRETIAGSTSHLTMRPEWKVLKVISHTKSTVSMWPTQVNLIVLLSAEVSLKWHSEGCICVFGTSLKPLLAFIGVACEQQPAPRPVDCSWWWDGARRRAVRRRSARGVWRGKLSQICFVRSPLWGRFVWSYDEQRLRRQWKQANKHTTRRLGNRQ